LTSKSGRGLPQSKTLRAWRKSKGSIAEELFQFLSRRIFAGIGFGFGGELAADKVKEFTKISNCLFKDRFRSAVAALLGGAWIVACAVEADAQIGVALMAGFASTGLAGKSPFPSAFMTVAGFGHVPES
jgi:hypothetical protein